jgi:GTPase
MMEVFRVPRSAYVPRKLPAVVLVGRPNVGKSTLFNRIARTRRSIVASVPGTTRDVISHVVGWQSRRFRLVDTGGMFGASQDPLHLEVSKKGQAALAAADVIVFLVDGVAGALPGDSEVAAAVRVVGKPVILVVNKGDDRRAKAGALEFHKLGFDTTAEISAEHGIGIEDLLDLLVERLGGAGRPDGEEPDGSGDDGELDEPTESRGHGTTRTDDVAVAIVGRPNVGKSSLVNRLLQEERVLVSDIPGTTRDAIDVVLRWRRRQYRIVDTAGIRRPGRVAQSGLIENISVLQSRRAIQAAEVVVLVIDAVEGPTEQDAAIAGEADKAGRGLIVAVNKWDLKKDGTATMGEAFDDGLLRRMKFLEYAPILHISALTGERVQKLLETVDRVAAARKRRVPTGELNRFIETVTAAHPPASPGKKELRVLYATQAGIAPPTFVLFTNVKTELHFSYERFLMNRFREAFGFEGSPVRIQVRAKRARRR